MMRAEQYQVLLQRGSEFFRERTSPAASPFPTWLLLVLMAFRAKRQRVDRRGSEAAGDGDECKGRDGEGCPFSTAEFTQRRQSNDAGKDPQLLVDGHCVSDEPDEPPCVVCTNSARMYCDLCSNRTTGAYCSNKGCRKFTKQSLDEHAAR